MEDEELALTHAVKRNGSGHRNSKDRTARRESASSFCRLACEKWAPERLRNTLRISASALTAISAGESALTSSPSGGKLLRATPARTFF